MPRRKERRQQRIEEEEEEEKEEKEEKENEPGDNAVGRPPNFDGLSALPGDVHLALAPYLDSQERCAVAATATGLLPQYGDRCCQRLELTWPRGRSLEALERFLLRQRGALTDLRVLGSPLLHRTASAIAAGCGHQLKILRLGFPWETTALGEEEAQRTAASLLVKPDPLPLLEELRLRFRPASYRSVKKFLAGLSAGTAPRLRKLELPLEDGPEMGHVLMFLVATLAFRAEKGCVGLAELEMAGIKRIHEVDVALRRFLWKVLLPSLERIGDWMLGSPAFEDDSMLAAIADVGAPQLRYLKARHPRYLLALPKMPRLESLELKAVNAVTGRTLDLVVSEAARAQEPLLPALRSLVVHFDGTNQQGYAAFFGAVARGWAAFQGVSELIVEDTGDADVLFPLGAVLADALAAGAFAALQVLEIKSIDADDSFEHLIKLLATLPAAQTLRKLRVLESCLEDGEGFKALGQLLAQGSFPALREMDFWGTRLGDARVVEFASSLQRQPEATIAIERLDLESVGMGDEGVRALLGALRRDGVGQQLVVLRLGESHDRMTDASALALAEALAEDSQHFQHLQYLYFVAAKTTRPALAELVRAAVCHCPALRSLTLNACGLWARSRAALSGIPKQLAPGRKISVDFENARTGEPVF